MKENLEVFFLDQLPPEMLLYVSKPFADVAHFMIMNYPGSAERSACIRKIMEARDCAVRACLMKERANES